MEHIKPDGFGYSQHRMVRHTTFSNKCEFPLFFIGKWININILRSMEVSYFYLDTIAKKKRRNIHWYTRQLMNRVIIFEFGHAVGNVSKSFPSIQEKFRFFRILSNWIKML